jgi:hypothetical protein
MSIFISEPWDLLFFIFYDHTFDRRSASIKITCHYEAAAKERSGEAIYTALLAG